MARQCQRYDRFRVVGETPAIQHCGCWRLMRVRDVVADWLGAVLGRQRFARLARFLWLRSQLDVRNDLQENGERYVQEAVLRRVKEKGFGRIFDIGANVGQWTQSLLDLADQVGLPEGGLELHLFEPAPESADVLESRLEKLPSNVRAEVNRVAVGAQHGRRQLHMAGPTAGTNSLFRSSTEPVQSAEVSCVTLDEYCRDHGISHVDLTKVDAEGADYRILEGGLECLREGVCSLVQFEYNHRWIYGRHYLRDAFELAESVGSQIGKVTPKGVEIYERWDRELERFREGNYLLGEDLGSLGIKVIPWWKKCRDEGESLNEGQIVRRTG